MVTTGNEVDVDLSEVIEYYPKIHDVRVIITYTEDIRVGNRILKALEVPRDAEKPIIFMKLGSTEAGARAAISHSFFSRRGCGY